MPPTPKHCPVCGKRLAPYKKANRPCYECKAAMPKTAKLKQVRVKLPPKPRVYVEPVRDAAKEAKELARLERMIQRRRATMPGETGRADVGMDDFFKAMTGVEFGDD